MDNPHPAEERASMREEIDRAWAIVDRQDERHDADVEALKLAISFAERVEEYARLTMRREGAAGPLEMEAAALIATLRARIEA